MLIGKRPAWLPLTLAFVALSLISAEGVAAKCSPEMAWPGLERGGAVILVDGSIVVAGVREGLSALDLARQTGDPDPVPRPQPGDAPTIRPFSFDLGDAVDDPSDIVSLEITCWNPNTGEIGGGSGLPIIQILTTPFVESTRAPIEALLRAQETYFSQHSRYAQSLDDLRAFGVPQDAMLEFSTTSTGWSGTTPRGDVDYRCFVYSGNATPELAEMKEHEVVCQPENAKASRALREMYESLVEG